MENNKKINDSEMVRSSVSPTIVTRTPAGQKKNDMQRIISDKSNKIKYAIKITQHYLDAVGVPLSKCVEVKMYLKNLH